MAPKKTDPQQRQQEAEYETKYLTLLATIEDMGFSIMRKAKELQKEYIDNKTAQQQQQEQNEDSE